MFRTLVFACLFTATAQAGTDFSSPYAGEWRGVGVQSDGPNWDMLVSIGDTQSVVTYPSLNCGGRWFHVEMDAEILRAEENIEYGLSNCINSGTVLLSKYKDGRVIFVWCGEDGAVSAMALLERHDASGRSYEEMLNATQAIVAVVGNDLKSNTCRSNAWLGV